MCIGVWQWLWSVHCLVLMVPIMQLCALAHNACSGRDSWFALPSSTNPTTMPCPVMPWIQAGSTFRSSPDGPRVCPVFSCMMMQKGHLCYSPCTTAALQAKGKSKAPLALLLEILSMVWQTHGMHTPSVWRGHVSTRLNSWARSTATHWKTRFVQV